MTCPYGDPTVRSGSPFRKLDGLAVLVVGVSPSPGAWGESRPSRCFRPVLPAEQAVDEYINVVAALKGATAHEPFLPEAQAFEGLLLADIGTIGESPTRDGGTPRHAPITGAPGGPRR